MKLKKFTLIFTLLMIIITIRSKAAYADVPYYGYTYDSFGRSVPTAVSYVPEKHVTGLDMGSGALNNPQDMFVTDANEIYILDSGNKRIVMLDENYKMIKVIDKITDKNGAISEMKNPGGIFVCQDKTIYIADTENGRVISINQDGTIQRTFVKPASQLFPQNVEFKPTKVIVDKAQDVYAVVTGVYQGAVMYDNQANFTGFYGANRVQLDAGVLGDYFWKTYFMNQEQRRKTTRNIPTTFTNFFIDKDGFVYACSKDDTSTDNVLKKLNSMGVNILRPNSRMLGYGDIETVWYAGNQIRTQFVDVNVDNEEFINVLDFTRGRVFQYDQDSNLIAIFGGRTNQEGTFDSAVAVSSLNGKIIVLDSKREDVTIFGLTEFGQWIHKAVKLYNDGLYEDSMEPWKEVLKRDNKLEIAHIGIGKALLKTGDYKGAMKEFKLGYDVNDYSKAYGQYMSQIIRKNMGAIVIVLILLYASVMVYKRIKKLKKTNRGVNI